MATIGLDATYTVEPEPSGVAEYSHKLIQALAALDTPHRFSLCYRLILVGGDGYGSGTIHEYIRRQGLGPRVQVRGYVALGGIAVSVSVGKRAAFPVTGRGLWDSRPGCHGEWLACGSLQNGFAS